MEKRVSTQVARRWFFALGHIALWYIAILVIINVVSVAVSTFDLPDFTGVELLGSSSALSYVFMLVVGIVMPLVYQKHFVSLGVTRKQMAQGMLLAVIGLSLLLALVNTALYLSASALGLIVIELDMLPLQFVRDVIIFVFYYALGWLICWGFTWARFATAALSIVVAALATNVTIRLLGDPLVIAGSDPGLLPEFAVIGIMVVVTGALVFILIRLLQRLPFKAT